MIEEGQEDKAVKRHQRAAAKGKAGSADGVAAKA